jgi:hypothetical protein
VDDDLIGPWRHDGGADGHFLDLNTVGGLQIVLAGLLVEVEVFLALNRCQTGVLDRLDAVEPFDTPRTNVTQHEHAKRESMDRRERLAVHLPH